MGVKHSDADFDPSPSFQGPRVGYKFTNGEQGVGYYRDLPAANLAPPTRAEPTASSSARHSHPQCERGRQESGGSRPPPRGERKRPMTAAEREERLRQFTMDAAAHESERRKRTRVDDAREAAEKSREAAEEKARIERALADEEKDEKDAQPEFLNKFAQGVYANTNVNSVADRINQQRHYVQKDTSERL